ncbi:NUDIX hydrolase [Paenibacillus spongiae]|uniref:NUDIX domain-containing protein n=1 Tax=Paenibacillus spongiae TaxID=2909671 RepID=A0ABY5SHT6_9BACL|nr:NUDIX domain-containing protein [Paenibacillus spongiae]UVI33143.1 NUDIX domain-containing protein [Paenibacillus spongiae]
MNILREEQDIAWLPLPNTMQFVLSDRMPEQQSITSAFVLAFQGDEMILTDLHSRGWDIPGGHVEEGESPAEAARRELYEETGAIVDSVELLGYVRIRLLGERPLNYKYPYPDSCMVFYWARISQLDDIESNDEIRSRGLHNPEQARTIPWIQDNYDFYEAALSKVINRKSE